MPPLHPGDPGDGEGDDDDARDDEVEFRPPLPPDDRLWRHPSEVASASTTPLAPRPTGPATSSPADSLGVSRSRTIGSRAAAAVVVVSALIGATSSLALVAVFGGFDGRNVEQPVALQPLTSVAGAKAPDEVASLAAHAAPAVAAVRVRRADVWTSGSAVVFRSDGHLVTNAHLIEDADEVDVLLHDGTTRRAELVGADPVTDLAVLHIDEQDLDTAAFGTSRGLQVGSRAVAIGAVDGGGWDTSVTTGVISALGRRLAMPGGGNLHDMIVIDAPLPRASTGGALVDGSGAVIGITSTLPAEDDDRFGAVTPIDLAHHVAGQLLEHGRVRHVWMGIEGTDLDIDRAMAMDLHGAVVVSGVIESGPAAEAGIERGDLLLAVDDRRLLTMTALIAELRQRAPGDTIALSVRRGDTELTVELVLSERRAED